MKTIENSRLIDEIWASLANRDCPLWFPEISPQLAKAAWGTLRAYTGLNPNNYGTARVLACDPTVPRAIFSRILIPQPSNDSESQFLVEILDGSAAYRYEELGLNFATCEEITSAQALECIREAMSILAQVPSLHDTVVQLVKVIHILRAQEDEYDVSHSDPAVPFSIFVSTPMNDAQNVAIRVMESIIHEALHLQLTLIEHVCTLVKTDDVMIASPWRRELRPPQGVLHGTYVFGVLMHVYLFFPSNVLQEFERNFIEQRISEIGKELAVAFSSLKPELLTPTGRLLFSALQTNTSVSSVLDV